MITQEQWTIIHRLKKQNWKIRQIGRQLNIARNTVRKALKQTSHEMAQPRAHRKTMLTPFTKDISPLAQEASYNARKVYLELCKRGYGGSYQQVQRTIKPLREQWWEERSTGWDIVPGKKGHVYWGSTLVNLGQTKVRVNIFLMMLGYSGVFTSHFALDETLPTFLISHKMSFMFFGGTPAELYYYRYPKKILIGISDREQVWNPQLEEFLRYCQIQPNISSIENVFMQKTLLVALNIVKQKFLSQSRFPNLHTLNTQFGIWRGDQVMNGLNTHTIHPEAITRFRKEQLHLQSYAT